MKIKTHVRPMNANRVAECLLIEFVALQLLSSLARFGTRGETSLYVHCDNVIPFCYYSHGIPAEPETLNQYGEKCKTVKRSGNVVYIDSIELKKSLDTFLKIYDLGNVILSASPKDGKWIWVPSGKVVDMTDAYKANGDRLYYVTKPQDLRTYYLVCISVCKPKWKELKDKAGENSPYMVSATTLEACQFFCEQNENCLSVDWDVGNKEKCGLFIEKTKTVSKKGVVHYEIDRSSQTIAICMSNVPAKPPPQKQGSPQIQNEVPAEPPPQKLGSPQIENEAPINVLPKEEIKSKNSSSSDDEDEHPWATYFIVCFAAAVTIMLICGFYRRTVPIDDDDDDEEED